MFLDCCNQTPFHSIFKHLDADIVLPHLNKLGLGVVVEENNATNVAQVDLCLLRKE